MMPLICVNNNSKPHNNNAMNNNNSLSALIAHVKSDLFLCETLRAAKAQQADEYGRALRDNKDSLNYDGQCKLGALITECNREHKALTQQRHKIVQRLNELQAMLIA